MKTGSLVAKASITPLIISEIDEYSRKNLLSGWASINGPHNVKRSPNHAICNWWSVTFTFLHLFLEEREQFLVYQNKNEMITCRKWLYTISMQNFSRKHNGKRQNCIAKYLQFLLAYISNLAQKYNPWISLVCSWFMCLTVVQGYILCCHKIS